MFRSRADFEIFVRELLRRRIEIGVDDLSDDEALALVKKVLLTKDHQTVVNMLADAISNTSDLETLLSELSWEAEKELDDEIKAARQKTTS